ncbi:SCO family protein [Petropleomorpha daqingensis]|uniref:Protein SCO1/2 n=1 Tax=Petropleomorpha daqingensis TaxID=2026353 RepID=A0A853CFC8_9ACTN|nr:protein SCO1/2 [Petropleomorpha daqingensis]
MSGSVRNRLAVLLSAGLLLAGCGGSGGSSGTEVSQAGAEHSHSAPAQVRGDDGGTYAGIDLDPPYQRPSFTLTDTSGAAYDFTTATQGRPTLLFFGYTNCPDVCPTTFADIAVALRKLDPAVAAQIQVVFVTTDPARDTPQVIREWLDRFDADLPTPFVGLTGDQATLDQAQLSAGVPLAQDGGQTHSALLLLYGADDKAHVAFDAGNTPKDIASDLAKVAAGS